MKYKSDGSSEFLKIDDEYLYKQSFDICTQL